jgi:AP-1 complex subunit beta-1
VVLSYPEIFRFLRSFFVRRYASEVDVDFVRKSIKAIGQTAIKIESAAERCVNVLLELIATRVSYVVQEAVVVMKVCAI